MLATDTYSIRTTSGEDLAGLNRLAASRTLRPLQGQVLVGERDGSPVAALSLSDGRVIADDAPHADDLVANLRTRAIAIWAQDETGVSALR